MNFGHILRRIEKFLSEISSFNGQAFFNLDRANEVYLLKLLDYVGIEICITSIEQFDLITKTDIEFSQIIENTIGRVKPYIERLNPIIKTITISDMNNFKIIEDVSEDFNLLLNINLRGNDIGSIGVLPEDIDIYFSFCKEIEQKFTGLYVYPKEMKDFNEIEKIIKKAKDEYDMVIDSIYIGNNLISKYIEKNNKEDDEDSSSSEDDEEKENTELEMRLKEICEKYNLKIYCDCSDYILNNCCFLYCQVTGKRIRENQNYIYLNDGLYGTLHDMLYKMQHIDVKTLHENCNKNRITTLFGPTCDSIDTVAKDLELCELDIGDWISISGNKFCPNTLTYFNSFDSSIILYLFC